MFEFLESSSSIVSKGCVDSYIEVMKKKESLFELFNNTYERKFILMNDDSKGIFGGAMLQKKSLNSVTSAIRNKLPSSITCNKEAWVGTVYLHLDNENLFPDFDSFCKLFYVELYQKLVEFGVNEGIDYMSVSLLPGEYLCTEILGFWPYVLELRPHESGDGLFHGILSLLKNRSKPAPQTWQDSVNQYNRLAA